ncbi:hypothetical protein H5410_028522 [Solanum commersonii]|uniref:Uncharacterized protein n=1 Tax=Solanum commersonii TaxID=4109 RepID=A0A9J5Z7S5_SOLCO|nr:hypothetical protein H5410_028522 [Solanum commersonii]
MEQKIKCDRFKSRPIVPGRVINLSQLRDSHCQVNTFFKAQKLSLFFSLCGLKLFEKVVRLFYANLRVSSDSSKLETLVLGTRIIANDLLFEDVFGTKFFGAKIVVAETGANLSDFGPLSLYFEHHILAYIIANTLLPRKGSLSNISNKDGHVEVGDRWVKKDFVQERADTPKPTKISAESAALLLQDFNELKTRIIAIERGLETLHDAVEKVFQLQKDTSTYKQVDSLKTGVNSSNNEVAISVQNSYSSLSMTVEHSYKSFSEKEKKDKNQVKHQMTKERILPIEANHTTHKKGKGIFA